MTSPSKSGSPSKMEATARPWTLELDPDGGFIITNGPASKEGTYVIAARVPLPHRALESYANAVFLIQAVNAHDALVNALHAAQASLCDHLCMRHEVLSTSHHPDCADARAALSLVGGPHE
jgi:hypothetical protein